MQTNLLASAGSKGEFFVWDVSKPSAAPTAYKSTRLDEIISMAWNHKVGHIIALGGKSGALSVWDLRKKSELIHIPTRYSISSIAWHPTEPTLLMTSSADDHNPVIQLWDLRNANSPRSTLTGHEKGVLNLSWCSQDPDLLLSSGSDNRTLIWNPFKAEIVAELPPSSQWVHKTSWCKKHPSILANATLDGKISIYSIQDTTTPAVAPVVDETPAGDDFFDSIPQNYQAQTVSFTLKQTPRWLKRPIGATFGFGGRLAQYTSDTTRVVINTHQVSSTLTQTVKDLRDSVATKSISEICQAAQVDSDVAEKQDWSVIETLTSEHARGALLEYLGFTKDEVEKDVITQLDNMDIVDHTPKKEQNKTTDSQEAQPSEPSVFGEPRDDEDDFLGVINSEATEPKPSDDLVSSSPAGAFEIIAASASQPDRSITRAVLTGQFDIAIDICLKEDRMSDAFMLALCGGVKSQERVRKAYFSKTAVPYSRLLSSVIAGDLQDVVQNADLAHWKEILAVLCNYAKPEDFSALCEMLGQRLEQDDKDQAHATLCYLAGSKLEHLVRIWASTQAKEEKAALDGESTAAPFEIHAAGLSKFIKKITIFRKAVSFEDSKTKVGHDYLLAPLYRKYMEFAGMIVAEGDVALALEYINLVPESFDGVEAMKKRLLGPIKPVEPAQKSNPMRPTGLRNVYTQPASPAKEPVNDVLAPNVSTVYQPSGAANPKAIQNPYAIPAASPIQGNAYAPPGSQPRTLHSNLYAPPQQAAQQAPQQQQTYQSYPSPYGGAQKQPNGFAPPPPRIPSSGPAILPAAQRKDITPWNDAPDIPLPSQRRATPTVNRSAIASPFPNQPSPTLAGFGAPQSAAIAPPPKTRSPAPARPQPAQVPTMSAPPQTRTISSPYAPVAAAVPAQTNAPSAPPSAYAAPPAGAGPTPAGYNGGPPQSAPQLFSPPPHAPQASFAPPPKSLGGPPKLTNSQVKPQSPVIKSPVVGGGGVVLSREPSRQGSPGPTKQEIPAAQYPAGDRSHIPPNHTIILDHLSTLLAHLQAVSPDRYRRPLEDTKRRLNVLFDQLNNAQLSSSTLTQVHAMTSALNGKDWGRGYAIHMELTANKMHEVRDWIVGIKTLIVVGKKSVEEAWQ